MSYLAPSYCEQQPLDPCLQPSCIDCRRLFDGIVTVQQFAASRRHDIATLLKDASALTLSVHLSVICREGTGAGSNFQKLKRFSESLPINELPMYNQDSYPPFCPRQVDFEIVFEQVETMVQVADRCSQTLYELRYGVEDPDPQLRSVAVRFLETWHLMHSYIIWLVHLFQMGLWKPEVTLKISAAIDDFPRMPPPDTL